MRGELTYSQAFARLEEIVAEIEAGEVDVDRLAARVKEASELIRKCRARLAGAEEEVGKVLAAMEEIAETPAGATAAAPPAPATARRSRSPRNAEPAEPAPAAAPAAAGPQPSLLEDDDFDPFADR
ncbi:MAG TPA: exodeoxyribonuclease VII small subunit [Chthonomonadales bacterium]|nr:exodeoxyribonuclease VII small subunit [Chthonomonadales bacterium]